VIKDLYGVIPVLSTPMDANGSLDLKILEKEIRWVKSHKIHSIATGMVSEILRMDKEERKTLTQSVCDIAKELSMNAVVSCGQESTRATISLVHHAEKVGATAVMINPPISTKLSSQETYQFFRDIFIDSTISIIVQDASGYVGNAIDINILKTLLNEFENRIYFKPEAIPIGQKLSLLRDSTGGRARIFEGTGGAHLVDSFTRGIVGTMPGTDICWAIIQLWEALVNKDWDTINLINGPVANMVNLLSSLDAYIAIEKHLLKLQGVFTNTYQKYPSGFKLDNETQTEAERIFAYLKILNKGGA